VLGAELDPADGRPCRGADGDKRRALADNASKTKNEYLDYLSKI
jgi:hypothetical protein